MNSKLKVLLGMNPFKFIWWNFLSNNVIRDKGKYLFPNWGAVIDISKSAKLILHAHLFLNNPSTNAKINGVIIAIIGRLLINSILIP